MDWDNPVAFSTPVGSIGEAQQSLGFTIYVPKNIGDPGRVVISDPNQIQQTEDRVVALIYDLPAYGRVVVEEEIPQIPPQEFDSSMNQLLALNGQADVHGTFGVASIRGGTNGYTTTSADGSASDIRWIEGGFEVLVRGPNLNLVQVVALAQLI